MGGIARLAGMDYYIRDSFTGSFDTTLWERPRLATNSKGKEIRLGGAPYQGHDLAGHDNRPDKKKGDCGTDRPNAGLSS